MKKPRFILRIILLSAFLPLFSIHMAAQKVTLSYQNVPFERVLNSIKQQTGLALVFSEQLVDVNRTVSINVASIEVEEALKQLLADTNVDFEIKNNKLYLIEKAITGKSDSGTVKKISGTVSTRNGEPIIGATVSVKNSSTATMTDVSGRFSLEVPADAVLTISYLGYETQEINVNGRADFRITLKEDDRRLDEVVVIGYGTQKRLNVTGSVAAISAKQLKQSPVANISNALIGRLPGLISVQRVGEPGNDAANIWIRGFGTYGSAQSPIIMVDGVERSYDNIDPNEIETISILKDASSTAIYGVRGANGVVLITTKRGTETKPRVNVNVQTAMQSPTRLPEYLDSYDALHLYRKGLINDGQNASLYTDEYINKYRDRKNPTYQYLYPSVNWQEALLKSHSAMTQANLNINGKNDYVKYFVSVSYLKQDGLYKYEDIIEDYNIQSKLERYNFRSNVDLSVTKDLDVEVNLGGIIRDRNYPNVDTDYLWSKLKMTPPWWYPMTNPDGSIPGQPSLDTNPYGMLTQTGYRRLFETTLQATTGFTLRLPWVTQGLSLRGRLSFDALNYRNITRAKGVYTYQFTIDENETDISKGTYTKVADGTTVLDYAVNANSNRKTLIELFLNYDRTFGEHNVKGLLLYSQQSYFAYVDGGIDNAIPGLPYKYQGVVGRGEYSLKNRYFAEFNFGYNGSENFIKGKRFGFFPAISIGWLASDEHFIKDNLQFLDLLKLRASVGEVGNDLSGYRFLYQGQWNLSQGGYTFGTNYDGTYYSGAIESAIGNELVTWERARKYNAGIDMGFWKSALKIEADFFYEHRDQILTQPLTIPNIVGIANLPMINAGIVDNKGFETVISYQKSYNDFGYFVKVNYTFARNKIIELTEPDMSSRPWQSRTGRRINEHYGLRAIGLFLDYDDIASSPTQTFGTVQPGDIKYADLNGDGKIDSQDEGYLGRVGIPESIAGLSLGFNYKGFDASILFQGAFGAYVYYGGSATYPFSRFAGVLAEVQANYFDAETNPDVNALYPRLTSNDNANNYRTSSFWHRKSDYVRLKNLEIGYTLPKTVSKKWGIDNARIYLNGINIFTWSDIDTFDPEIPDGTGSYPQQKVYNLGINFSF